MNRTEQQTVRLKAFWNDVSASLQPGAVLRGPYGSNTTTPAMDGLYNVIRDAANGELIARVRVKMPGERITTFYLEGRRVPRRSNQTYGWGKKRFANRENFLAAVRQYARPGTEQEAVLKEMKDIYAGVTARVVASKYNTLSSHLDRAAAVRKMGVAYADGDKEQIVAAAIELEKLIWQARTYTVFNRRVAKWVTGPMEAEIDAMRAAIKAQEH